MNSELLNDGTTASNSQAEWFPDEFDVQKLENSESSNKSTSLIENFDVFDACRTQNLNSK